MMEMFLDLINYEYAVVYRKQDGSHLGRDQLSYASRGTAF